MTARLITFRPSHYCEKARWALDRAGIAYREESHVPVLSWLATFGAGGRRTVPCLVVDGRTIPDSTDILRWLDGRGAGLFPDADSAQLEEDFDRGLGPAARRLTYQLLMRDEKLLRDAFVQASPPSEARLAWLLFPLIRRLIVRALRIDDAGVARSRAVIDRTFATVEARLADGRRYLTGDRFTGADLTFAALGYLLVWPDEAARRLETPLPPTMAPLVEEMRATTAGRFALRLWAEDRG